MPSPNNPTRYPAGVVNATQDGAWGNFLQPRPDLYTVFFDDFLTYTATNWVVTETDAGATQTIVTAGLDGQLALTNTAGGTDNVSLQWGPGGTTVATQFLWEATKDLVVSTRFKLSAVVDQAAVVGLAIADTSPGASLPANGIFFYKADGAAALIASVRKAGASTSVALGNMVADTFINVSLFYTAGDHTWRAFVNDTLIGSFSTLDVSPIVALAPTIGLLNGDTVANVLTIDRLIVAKQR